MNGYWVVQDDIESDDKQSSELEDCDVTVLRGDVKVLFNRTKRKWDVKRIEKPNETTTPDSIDPPVPFGHPSSSSNEDTCSIAPPVRFVCPSSGSSNEDTCSIAPPVPFVRPSSSSNEDTCSIDEKKEYDLHHSTWRESDVRPYRTINNCGQSFQPFDDSYEIGKQHVTDTSKINLHTLTQNFTEIQILEDAIQKLFYYIEKKNVLPVECLDDVKYPDVRRLVCVDLCSALNGVLKNGLKKRRTLFGATRYTVWEVVKGISATDITDGIVKKISSLGPTVDDKIRFEIFVCECINQGTGALASWLESLQNNRKKLNSFYEDESLVIKLPRDGLEKLLSRLTFLQFNITFYEHVRRKMKEDRQLTFEFE
jgi:hypothetical protein